MKYYTSVILLSSYLKGCDDNFEKEDPIVIKASPFLFETKYIRYM